MADLNGEVLDNSIKNFFEKCATALLQSLSLRFRFVRDVTSTDFMVLPAAATLLDLRYSWILLLPTNAALLAAAKQYILSKLHLVCTESQNAAPVARNNDEGGHSSQSQSANDGEPATKRFKFLANTMAQVQSASRQGLGSQSSVDLELTNYMESLANGSLKPLEEDDDCLAAWQKRACFSPTLASLAADLLSLPCSEAYVERLFSTCGMLTSGRRNKMSKNLQKRVFLKHNLSLV